MTVLLEIDEMIEAKFKKYLDILIEKKVLDELARSAEFVTLKELYKSLNIQTGKLHSIKTRLRNRSLSIASLLFHNAGCLLQQDKTGSMTYSDVVRLDQTAKTSPTAFVSPNPVRNNASISIYTIASHTVQVFLYGSDGRSIWSGRIFIQPGQQKIAVPVYSLSQGVYHAVLMCMGEQDFTQP